MCGICGLSHSDGRMGDLAVLRTMNDAIRHRGPDTDGYFTADGVGLAVRRLANHLVREMEIGAGRHGDGVVLGGDLDDRDAGRGSVDLAHAGAVDVAVGEKAAQAVGKGIVAALSSSWSAPMRWGRTDTRVPPAISTFGSSRRRTIPGGSIVL